MIFLSMEVVSEEMEGMRYPGHRDLKMEKSSQQGGKGWTSSSGIRKRDYVGMFRRLNKRKQK